MSKELPQKISEDYSPDYDSVEFNVNTGESNYNVQANISGAFNKIKNMRTLTIKTTKNISIKLNSILNPSISLTGANKTLKINSDIGFEVNNIFITNSSGATAAIKIMGN
jgi:hypothetical protein